MFDTGNATHPLLEPGVRIVAYRGGGGERPENTLTAFGHAAGLSPRIVLEVDIQRTADGVLVALHDDTVDRTTDGHGRVDALTLARLKALDAGFHFADKRGGWPFRGLGVQVPSIDELFAAHPTALFVLDVHARSPSVPADLVRLVEKHDASSRVVIASEDSATVTAARRLRPSWLFAATAPQLRARKLLEHARLDWLAPGPRPCILMVPEWHGRMQVLTKRLINVAHRRGERVWPWLVESPNDAARLLQMGADCLFTSVPSRLLEAAEVRAASDDTAHTLRAAE